MRSEPITVELQLPGLRVNAVHETEYGIDIVAQYERDDAICPASGLATGHVHQWRRQRKQDLELWDKRAYLVLWKRRFRCKPCRKVFTEDDPLCGRRRRTTCRLRRRLGKESEDVTVRTTARWHAVSEGLVQRSWLEAHSVIEPPARPHRYLGMDGFCVRKPGRMWTGLWDLETRRPIAIVPGQRKDDLHAMLRLHASRRSVLAVCIDLAEAERQAIRVMVPHAAIVADKFHVVALASRALREVHGERRLRGSMAWLLQRGVERLGDADRRRLADALQQDERVRTAWILKEELRRVYRARTIGEAEVRMDRWIADARASHLAPFVRTARTIQGWRTEILAYWTHRITNACVEGKHNRVKVLKRRGYGYRNDRVFQLRILNLFHTH